jgi:hypothetical protein
MKNQILKTLESIDGGRATFATIVTETTPKMRKTNNPFFGRVTKVSKISAQLNTNYTQKVNNQRGREGSSTDFQAKANWHEPVTDMYNGCISRHKKDTSKLYLNYVEMEKKTAYLLDGFPATPEQLKAIFAFFPASAKKVKQNTAEAQGLEKPIIYRLVAIDNIKRLTVNKQTVTG